MRNAIQGVDQGHEFGSSQGRVLGGVRILVELKQDLQSRSVALGLNLAPKSAFVTPDTVHHPTDVSEAIPEFLLQNRSFFLEHFLFIEDHGFAGDRVGELQHLGFREPVLQVVAGAEGILGQIVLELRNSTEKDGVVEVDVLDALGMAFEPIDKTVKIRAPFTSALVEIVPAKMNRDASVHSGYDSVKHALLQTLVINLRLLEQGELPFQILFDVVGEFLMHHIFEALLCLACCWWRLRILGFREAVFSVDGFPHVVRAGTGISSETLRIVDQADVFSVGASFVFGNAVIALVALVFLYDTAFFGVFTQLSAEWTLGCLLVAVFGVLRLGPSKLSQLLRSPYLGYVFLVVDGVDGASDVGAHSLIVRPEGTCASVQVQSVVAEIVGTVCNVLHQGSDFFVQLFEASVGGASVRYEFGRFILSSSSVSTPLTVEGSSG
jgi:hypothetical protein